MNVHDVSQPTRGRRTRRAVLAVTVAAAFLVGLPETALAQTTINQRFHVISAGPPGAKRIVVASGMISGVGTEVIESNPPGVANLRWTFPEGTLFVTTTYSFENVLDPQTCHRTVTLTGTWEITGGTGEFTEATGGGEFSGTNRIHLTRTPDGCAPPPTFLRQVFSFTGDASLAGAAAA